MTPKPRSTSELLASIRAKLERAMIYRDPIMVTGNIADALNDLDDLEPRVQQVELETSLLESILHGAVQESGRIRKVGL